MRIEKFVKSVRFKIVRQFALEIVGEKSLKDYTSKNEDKTMTIISITFRNTEKKSPPVGRGKADDEEPLTGPKIWNQDHGAAIAWEQEECGDATEAGGGNLRSNSDLPIFTDLESLSVPKTPIIHNSHLSFL